jgi:hypothetical protein
MEMISPIHERYKRKFRNTVGTGGGTTTNIVTNNYYSITGGDLTEISLASANWNSTYVTVQANSAYWEAAYTNLLANSAAYLLSGSDVDLGQIPMLSASWTAAYTAVTANSAHWEAAYTNLLTNSAAYLLSGAVTDLGDIPLLSANWNSTYTIVQANSSNWSDAYTNLVTNSATYLLGGSSDLGDIPTLSANWNSTYTIVQANSTHWEAAYTNLLTNSAAYLLSGTETSLGDIPLLSANWNSAYTTVCSHSATWDAQSINLSYLSSTFLETISALKEPTGFEERTSSTLNFVASTRTFTFTPNNTIIWSKGVKTIYTISLSTQINNTTGSHYFYINENGNYTYSDGTSWSLESPSAPIAYVYWNGADYFLLEERHGCVMDGATHRNLHLTRGTQLLNGLLPFGYTVQAGAGTPTISTVSFGITQGQIADEDITFSIGQFNQFSPYTILYRTVSGSGMWTWTQSMLPYLTAGSNIAYNRSSDWSITEITTNNTWINSYVFATTTLTPTGRNIFIIPSQASYSTLALAQAETVNTLQLGSLPFQEIVAIAKFTYRRVGSNPTTYNARLEAYERLIGSNISITNAAAATNHNSLAGLQGGTTGEYYHLTEAQNSDFIGKSEIVPLTANWQSAYTITTTNSANWTSGYTIVQANSANWNGTYTAVSPNSANWNGVYTIVQTNSANWSDAYTNLVANSGFYLSGDITVLTTKGDLATFTTTISALPVGVNNSILIADSTADAGIKWYNNTTGFTGYLSADQTIAAATYTTLPCQTERFDDGGNYNTSTGKYTVPATGTYLVCWGVRWSNRPASRSYYAGVGVNGAGQMTFWEVDYEAGSVTRLNATQTGAVIIRFNSGDTIELRCYQNYTSTVTVLAANPGTYMSVRRIF